LPMHKVYLAFVDPSRIGYEDTPRLLEHFERKLGAPRTAGA